MPYIEADIAQRLVLLPRDRGSGLNAGRRRNTSRNLATVLSERVVHLLHDDLHYALHHLLDHCLHRRRLLLLLSCSLLLLPVSLHRRCVGINIRLHAVIGVRHVDINTIGCHHCD